MKLMFSDNIFDSGILKEEIYTVLYEPINDMDSYKKISLKNPTIKLNQENFVTWGVAGCDVDVNINHHYEVLYEVDNIENMLEVDSYIKYVFALGGILFDQIPATWNVIATIEFPTGVPHILKDTTQKKHYCLSSFLLWEKLINFHM